MKTGTPSLIGVSSLPVILVLLVAGCTPKPPEHGTSFLLELDLSSAQSSAEYASVLRQTQTALCRRFSAMGIRAFAEPVTTNRILLKVPLLPDELLKTARQSLGRGGVLHFHLVHEDSDNLLRTGVVPAGYEVKKEVSNDETNQRQPIAVLAEKKAVPGLSGRKAAFVTRDRMNNPQINFKLDSEGAAAFAKITRENIHRRLAIFIDDCLFSAPVIQSEIPNAEGVITGRFTEKEAFDLANLLQNALGAPITVIEERSF